MHFSPRMWFVRHIICQHLLWCLTHNQFLQNSMSTWKESISSDYGVLANYTLQSSLPCNLFWGGGSRDWIQSLWATTPSPLVISLIYLFLSYWNVLIFPATIIDLLINLYNSVNFASQIMPTYLFPLLLNYVITLFFLV